MGAAAEFHLFCLALRRPRRAEDLATLEAGIAAGPDWRCILEGARRHRVATPLLAGLQACQAPPLPSNPADALRADALAAARRSLGQAAELARLGSLFAAAGIRMLALKGVALSMQLYGECAGRDPRDIDLLVDQSDLEAADHLLCGAAYTREGPPLSPRQHAAYRRWIKDCAYVHAESGIRVELHHRLNDNPVLLAIDFGVVWREREEVEIAGVTVAVLPRRLLGLFLGLHGAVHCWEELRWLVDFAAALQPPGAVEALLVDADGAGIAGPIRHALMLAHDWLGAPVDARAVAAARADRHVAHLHRILRHLYDETAWHVTPQRRSVSGFLRYSLWVRLYNYSLKAEWRYWRYQTLREFVTPADWQVISLPDALFWLFPLLRPVGWLVRRCRG